MADPVFRHWLTQRSWALTVRYLKAVGWLLPVGALAKDVPMWLSDDRAQHARLPGLLAWQVAIGATVLAVLLVDRFIPRARGREAALYLVCAVFMVVITWAGVTGVSTRGTGLALYAACCTFLAAVISTPVPVRQPMYVLSFCAIAAAAWPHAASLQAWVGFLVNPFCVAMLCLWLDRFTYSRDLALYTERQRAEAERERADRVLCNALPRAVAEELMREGRVRARKVQNLGVLFADLVGFTRLASRLPPDALVMVLDEVFTTFDSLVERHGAEKIKTIGDAYMAVAEDGALALCRLALDMQDAVAGYNRVNGTDLAMRIGIHAGPAVAGVVGLKRPLYDVWVDTVNIASRIESTGRAGAIHVSATVVAQVGGGLGFTDRGLVELEGRGRMRTAWLSATEPAAEALRQAA